MGNFEIYRDIILLALGLIGACLSVYNLLDARARRLRKVKVSFKLVYPLFKDDSIDGPLLKVLACNLGYRDVTITDLGIELPKRKTLAFLGETFLSHTDTLFPARLSDGEMAERHYICSGLNEGLKAGGISSPVKIKPFAVDTTGKRHYGKRKKWPHT